jgi:hypothetical protein
MNLTERRSNAENNALEVVARRLRIQRVELFARLVAAQRGLSAIFAPIAEDLASWVEGHGTPAGIRSINERIRQNMILMRQRLNPWLHSIVRDSSKMSLRHAQDALVPIFEDNQEALRKIAVGVVLAEAKISIGLAADFASKNSPKIKMSSDKWQGKQMKVINQVMKKPMAGLKPSDRIWELTRRSEAELKRLVVSGIAEGQHPTVIAKKIKKYVSPQKTKFAESPGAGVYKSPFKNAMRIARTEAIKAYNLASAEFAKDKDWITGIQVKLSPNHEVEDECDGWANGEIISPEEFADNFPLHPHCMCMGVYVIDKKFLGEEK